MTSLRLPRAHARIRSTGWCQGGGALRLLTALLVALAPLCSLAAPGCNVSALTLTFGAYDTLNSVSSTTTISLNCVRIQQGAGGTVAYSIALSAGVGSYAARQMNSGANVLLYNLYTDAPHTTVWGDGTGGSQTVNGTFTSPPGNQTATLTLYGLIPGSQNVVPGTYTTTTPITVTVTY
jgi:spore coat protein U-like protein